MTMHSDPHTFLCFSVFVMFKLCTNKNHPYKHEQINNQNIDNSECFGVKSVNIYPEMTSQYFFEKIWFCKQTRNITK
jgi:hypothetical protein